VRKCAILLRHTQSCGCNMRESRWLYPRSLRPAADKQKSCQMPLASFLWLQGC
jgi:hypothetical protein